MSHDESSTPTDSTSVRRRPTRSSTERPRRAILYPYQRRYLTDGARAKVVNKSRRIGFSWVVALEAAMCGAGFRYDSSGRLQYNPAAGVDQRITSATERQAKELLEYVRQHLEALEVAIGRDLIDGAAAERIRLTNGRSCYAMAPSPRSVRGGQGDLILDEFAWMPNAEKVWNAAQAVTGARIGRPEGYRVRVISTPCGDEGPFYNFCEGKDSSKWSQHYISIWDAVEEGFPEQSWSPERRLQWAHEQRDFVGDPDVFGEEYECAFLSSRARYISRELYDACLFDHELEMPLAVNAPGYAGMDVARKRDLSAIVELRSIADHLWHDRTHAERGAKWADQEAWVRDVMTRCDVLAVDATGMGSQFAERLSDEYGPSRIDPVEFTLPSKERLATGLKAAMSEGRLKLRDDDIDLRREVLNLRREVTDAGNIRYDAPRERGNHADRAWALALAAHAAGKPVDFEVQPIGRRRKSAGLRSAR